MRRPPAGELPSLQQLGFDAATLRRCASDTSAAGAGLRGGESEALRRLQDFVARVTAPPARAGASSTASADAGASDGSSFCCKISPWLALGCLSPRQLFNQLQQRLGAGGNATQQVAKQGGGGDAGGAALSVRRGRRAGVRLPWMPRARPR